MSASGLVVVKVSGWKRDSEPSALVSHASSWYSIFVAIIQISLEVDSPSREAGQGLVFIVSYRLYTECCIYVKAEIFINAQRLASWLEPWDLKAVKRGREQNQPRPGIILIKSGRGYNRLLRDPSFGPKRGCHK